MANPSMNTMVQKETYTSKGLINSWFGGRLDSRTGFSLEVFRRGKYQLSLSPNDDTSDRLLKDGDEILAINLGPQTLDWTGRLKTRDGYELGYHIIVGVRVINPPLFAERYRQGVDSFQETKNAIQVALANAVPNNEHANVQEVTLRRITLDRARRLIQDEYGLAIGEDSNLHFAIDPDPRYIEFVQQGHRHEVERREGDHQLNQQGRTKEFERDQQVRDKDLERDQRMKDALTNEQIATMGVFSDIERKYLMGKFAELRRDGYSIKEIVEMLPDVTPILLQDPNYRAQVQALQLPKPVVDADRNAPPE